MRRIVVGVDGSQSSRNALNWAVREARAHGARVEAVHVWQVPAAAFYPPGAIALDVGTYEEQAKQQLDEIVDSTDTTGLADPIERIVTCGPPARTLLEVAKGADLLVVGSRGRGGFAGLVLGSVSQQCVHHAPCPVVVVRPRQD
ncbi:MAG TPA: universal stress protein [Acidimicrobiales bacterium]